MWRLSKILVICLFIQSSHAYSMGAPDNACRGMTPGKLQFEDELYFIHDFIALKIWLCGMILILKL